MRPVKPVELRNRLTVTAAKVGENAPVGAVCCGVCRTCATTNVVTVAFAAVAGAIAIVVQKLRRPPTT